MNEMTSNTSRIYRLGDIDLFPLSIPGESSIDNYKPQGTKKTLDPNHRANEPKSMEGIAKSQGKIVGRRALRHPPSSNTRNSKKPKILKDSNERMNRYNRVHLLHAPDGIVHGRDPLSNR
jgi:hypothetical protein